MKTYFQILFIVIICFTARGHSQGALLWGASAHTDSIWSMDTTSWTVADRISPSLPGDSITGITGLAFDPCGHETYAIMKLNGYTERFLGKIDLHTGICTMIGSLGDKFASITFREDGQLFGLTGNGAAVAESMFMIDKGTGGTALVANLGTGHACEIMSYNFDDHFFYRWGGTSPVTFEQVLSATPYTDSSITTGGAAFGDIFGALYLGSGKFILANDNSSFHYFTSDGTCSPSFSSCPDNLRGLVMPPEFKLDENVICENQSVTWSFNGGVSTDDLIFHWGDGSSDSLPALTGFSHTYASPGVYNSYVVLSSPCNPADTVFSSVITVEPNPVANFSASMNFMNADFSDISAGNPTTWSWQFGDGDSSNVGNPSHTYSIPGLYTVCLTVSTAAGCSHTFCDSISVTNVAIENSLLSGVQLFPNPNFGQSLLSSPEGFDLVSVYDSQGRFLFSCKDVPRLFELPASGVSGLYFVSLQRDGKTATLKWICY